MELHGVFDISTLFTDCQSLYNVSLFTESGFGPGLAGRRGKEETVQRRAALWLWEAVRPSLKPSWIYRVAENSLDTRCTYDNFVFVRKYSKELREDLHSASMEKGETLNISDSQ